METFNIKKELINNYLTESIKSLQHLKYRNEFVPRNKSIDQYGNIIFEICNLERNKIDSAQNNIEKAHSHLKIAFLGQLFEFNEKIIKENAEKAYNLVMKSEKELNLNDLKTQNLKKQFCIFAKNIVEEFKLEKENIETIKDELYMLNLKFSKQNNDNANANFLRKI